MKRILALSLAIMTLSSLFSPALAQAETKKATKKATIKYLTEAVYDEIGTYSEGLVWVKKGDTYQYLDESGKVVIDLSKKKYTSNKDAYIISVGDFHEGLALVTEEEVIYYDDEGSLLWHPGYYIDTKGNIVLTTSQVTTKLGLGDYHDYYYDNEFLSALCSPFSGDVTISKIGGYEGDKLAVIGKDGSTKIDEGTINNWYNRFTEDLLCSSSIDDNMWGYVDKNLKNIIPFKYEQARPFNQGLAPVKINGKWGFINKKGKTVIKAKYESFVIMDSDYTYQVFNDGLAAVKKDGKWGAINKAGKTVIPFKYESYFYLCNGYAIVEGSDGKYTYIDKKGKAPFKTKYDDANDFSKAGIALVGNKGVYKLIDTKGKKIGTKTWKFDGTWVSNMTPDIIGYKKGEKWGIAKIK